MIRINIHDAKTHLSRYLQTLKHGQVIVLCRRNIPIAEIRAIAPKSTEPRPVGLARGQFEIPASFFEPLPVDVIDRFEGRTG